MGPRKRILGAIASLEQGAPAAGATTSERGPEQARTSPGGEAERRQLTVMFCDLAGSTALTQHLDPEEVREINRRYQDAAKASIERFDGFVARYMGDGVLAYFGYPRAHEDDAERAVRAGLSLLDAMGAVNADSNAPDGVELAVRVGIATGPVVVGDLIGEGASQESAVVGETPNLAARLQGLAAPNSVVVAASTHDLESGHFEYEDLGEQRVKGIAEPVRAWRVVAPIASESRFEAAHRAGFTTFVGREQEIALLMERWQTAKQGEGQVVLLSGEAGIGKSRIMEVLKECMETEPHTRLRYQCSPHYTSSALFPIINQLEIVAGFTAKDSSETRLEKLERLLEQSAQPDGVTLSLFASLLSIPISDPHPPLELSPQEQKDRTLKALVTRLEGLAADKPVFSIVEDAHWIDPTTSELLDLIVDAVQNLPILLVITFRPEYDSPWSNYPHATTLTLNRLTRRQTEALASNAADGKTLPVEVMDQIAAKTDGVPLFVEELTKNVVESGLLIDAGDHYDLAGPLPPLAIPASLQDSLMARLDRLASVREVAQMGAAIGREFSYELIRAIADVDEDTLLDTLDRLSESELIFRRGTPPNATYLFKHALVQDAAYGSLLKSRRQHLHAQIAKVLTERYRELAERQPELLAHHYAQAGLAEPALEHWQAAAQRAIGRSAYQEAIEQLDQALVQLEKLPADEARDKRELELHVMKFGPLFPVKGYASREAEETSARALTLCRSVGDNDTYFPAMYARWAVNYVKSSQKEIFDLSLEYLQRANEVNYDAARMVGNRIHAVALLLRGDVEDAYAHARKALDIYDPAEHGALLSRFGQDLKVQAINYLSVSGALLGKIDEVEAIAAEAIEHAHRVNHVNTLAYALWHVGVWLPSIIRDSEAVHRHGTELLQLIREQRLGFWEAFGRPHIAINGYGKTPAEAAIEAEQALERLRGKYRCLLTVPELLCRIGDAYLDAGLVGDAERTLNEAAGLMKQTGEVYWEPELYRARGRLAAMTTEGFSEKAVVEFQKAIDIARKKGIKLLELRAATALARLWIERGDDAKAWEVLSPSYDSFEQGFDKPDLQDAKKILDALRGGRE